MKIVIALDSFKGSCSAQAACAAVAQGLRRVDQTLELVEMPVSDGGEGLLSTLADSPLLEGAVWQQQRCTSPYGLSLQADFLILPGERAIIEMAQSCGLELTPPAQRDVRQASSYAASVLPRRSARASGVRTAPCCRLPRQVRTWRIFSASI